MSADKPTEWLIDSLYPEEDVETASYELTPEDHVQRLEMEHLLGSMREHMPVVSPSPTMREMLLQTAQAAIAQEVEQEAAVSGVSPSRAPNVARTPSTSGWQRSKVNALAQITSVAIVLVLGVIFVAQLQHSALDEAGMTSHDLLASKSEFKSSGAAIAEQAKEADFPDKAPMLAEPEPNADSIAKQDVDVEGRSSVGELALGRLNNDKNSDLLAKDVPQEIQQAAKPRRSRAAPKKTRSAKTNVKSKISSAFGGLSSSRGAAYGKDPYGKSAEESEDVRAVPNSEVMPTAKVVQKKPVAQEPVVQRKPEPAPAPKQAPVRVQSKSAVANAQARPPAPSSPPSSNAPTPRAQMTDASSVDIENSKKGLSKPGSGVPTYDSIQRSARAERHNTTLSQADGYLKSGQGSVTQRARVLELKAQALKSLGRSAEADRVLASIRSKYPSYYKKQNLRKKKKTMKRKSVSETDSKSF